MLSWVIGAVLIHPVIATVGFLTTHKKTVRG